MRPGLINGLLILTLLSLLLCGCSANRSLAGNPNGEGYHPDWWLIQLSVKYLYSFGQAVTYSKAASLESARADAIQKAAPYVHAYLQDITSVFQKEAGISEGLPSEQMDRIISTVSRSRFDNQETGQTETIITAGDPEAGYKTFLQLRIPKREINRTLLAAVLSDSTLYRQYSISAAFRQLEADLR